MDDPKPSSLKILNFWLPGYNMNSIFKIRVEPDDRTNDCPLIDQCEVQSAAVELQNILGDNMAPIDEATAAGFLSIIKLCGNIGQAQYWAFG